MISRLFHNEIEDIYREQGYANFYIATDWSNTLRWDMDKTLIKVEYIFDKSSPESMCFYKLSLHIFMPWLSENEWL